MWKQVAAAVSLFAAGHVTLAQRSGNESICDYYATQRRLFTHWFTAFGFIYGCSFAPKFPRTADSGGPLSAAYVHKFMNLNQTDIGYFIKELTVASRYFGFSDEDAQTLDTFMNARYNVRCAPPVNGQLYSICFADECPLAQPQPDCDAYKDLSPGGTSNITVVTTTIAPTVATPTSATATASPTAAAESTSSNSNSVVLSNGAIAGIAIGGAAVLLLALGLILYFRRQSKSPQIVPVPVPSGGYGSPTYPTHTTYSTNPHTSMASTSVPHEPYMGAHNSVSGFWVPPKPQEMGQNVHETVVVARPASMSPPLAELAEMESP
ncbi:hypothetical protein TASIC1_0005004200 [Trichoderma asperellum]|uniref:Uncharacterized protein n=1 Tax=Trichoderma asperellum TaxID=101201 RepID=A0A6V8QRI4_TRIAP|nr:hypothetical protein TASIC1_0005004200 [Trichoderma asperellum]